MRAVTFPVFSMKKTLIENLQKWYAYCLSESDLLRDIEETAAFSWDGCKTNASTTEEEPRSISMALNAKDMVAKVKGLPDETLSNQKNSAAARWCVSGWRLQMDV